MFFGKLQAYLKIILSELLRWLKTCNLKPLWQGKAIFFAIVFSLYIKAETRSLLDFLNRQAIENCGHSFFLIQFLLPRNRSHLLNTSHLISLGRAFLRSHKAEKSKHKQSNSTNIMKKKGVCIQSRWKNTDFEKQMLNNHNIIIRQLPILNGMLFWSCTLAVKTVLNFSVRSGRWTQSLSGEAIFMYHLSVLPLRKFITQSSFLLNLNLNFQKSTNSAYTVFFIIRHKLSKTFNYNIFCSSI